MAALHIHYARKVVGKTSVERDLASFTWTEMRDLFAKVDELEARLAAKDKGIDKLEALVKQYADGAAVSADSNLKRIAELEAEVERKMRTRAHDI